MKVGIYMPSSSGSKTAPVFYDGLEGDFFRRALTAIHGQVAHTDVHFFWFDDGDSPSPCSLIPSLQVNTGASVLRLVRGSGPTIEQSVKDHDIDVLLTRIDAPPVRLSIPKILFTLDMLFHGEAPPGSTTPPPPLSKKIKQACSEAKGILCPSEYVHKACASRLEMGLEKATVARAGVSKVFSEAQPPVVEDRYALFILNRYTFPSIPTFIDAIRKNRSLFPPTLVILGPLHPEEPADWELPVVRIEHCPDAMAAGLMQHAQACFYPAKGEGSGMPVLQAMCAGAMLITTKSGALFEVAGSSPFYCEADNHFSILQALRRMLDETPPERDKRRQMSRSLILDCTWERCGARIISAVKRGLVR